MAILEVTLVQAYFGQQVINRWHYVSSGTPAAVSLSFACLSALGFLNNSIISGDFPTGSLARGLQDNQSAALTYVSAAARDLFSDTDFYENPYATGVVGNVAGEAVSPVLAFGITSNRVRQSVRRGQKRIAGLVEAKIDAGGVLSSSAQSDILAVSDRMSAVVMYDDEGNTLSFSPAVLSFLEYTTPKGTKAYKPYPSVEAQLEHAAVGVLWSPKTTVRTQGSRQYGRGI